MKEWIVTAGLLGLLMSLSYGQQNFSDLDANGDGGITAQELPSSLRASFDKADRNGDGKISRLEHFFVQRFIEKRQQETKARQEEVFRQKGITVTRNLDYAGSGNRRQQLDVYSPSRSVAAKAKLPVYLWIHGGGWRSGSKEAIHKVEAVITSGKYIVVSVNYRLTDEAIWPAQIHDVKAALRYVRAHAKQWDADPKRIAVGGASAGGHLATMLGVAGPDAKLEGTIGAHLDVSTKVSAVVDLFGPKDLYSKVQQFPGLVGQDSGKNSIGRLLGGPIGDHLDAAKSASPLAYVSKGDAPTLTIHGTEDTVVPYAQSTAFEKAYEAVAGPLIFLTVTGAGHGTGFGPEVNATILDFLNVHLYGHRKRLQDQRVKSLR